MVDDDKVICVGQKSGVISRHSINPGAYTSIYSFLLLIAWKMNFDSSQKPLVFFHLNMSCNNWIPFHSRNQFFRSVYRGQTKRGREKQKDRDRMRGLFRQTFGIRDIPPTKMTSPMSDFFTSASCRAFWQGPTVRFTRCSTKDSNLDRDSFMFMCFGPLASIVR